MEPLNPGLRLYEGAFEAIRQYVVREKLRPGDPLPSERQMQQQLGISRAPVREALRVLQSVGMIEARQGKGLFVKRMDLRPVVDTFVSHLELVDETSFEHCSAPAHHRAWRGGTGGKERTTEDLAGMAGILGSMRARIDREEFVSRRNWGSTSCWCRRRTTRCSISSIPV